MSLTPTIHATTVVLGTHGVLIRGRPGAGKSSLALHLLGRADPFVFSALVSDDRTIVGGETGRLIARVPDTIAGLAEIRGLGVAPVRRHARCTLVSLIVDLVGPDDSARIPDPHEDAVELDGVRVPVLRLPDAGSGNLDAKANAVLTALGLSWACHPPTEDG